MFCKKTETKTKQKKKKEKRKETRLHFVKKKKKERNQSLPPTYQALWWGCRGSISFILRARQGKCLSIILQMRKLSSRSWQQPSRDCGSRWSASVICLESFTGSRPSVLGRAQPVLLFTVSPSFFNFHDRSPSGSHGPSDVALHVHWVPVTLTQVQQPHVFTPSLSPCP